MATVVTTQPLVTLAVKSNGTRGNAEITLDGQPVVSARALKIDMSVDNLPTAQIDVSCRGLDLELPALCAVTVVAIPGYVVERVTENGVTRWRAVKE